MRLHYSRPEDRHFSECLGFQSIVEDGFDPFSIGMLPGVATSILQAPSPEYHFLHESAVIEYHGTLFAAWYNCPDKELAGHTPIRGRRSTDGGRTWGEVEILGEDPTGELIYCPPVYGVSDDTLYLFMNTMVRADHIHSIELYRFDEEDGKFHFVWSKPIPFKLNTNAYHLANGKLFFASRSAPLDGFPDTPAVLLNDSGTCDGEWRIVNIQPDCHLPDGVDFEHPECSAIARGNHITVFCRNDWREVPLLYESEDFGETWTGPKEHDLPFSSSKIYSGVLSDGRSYIIGNVLHCDERRQVVPSPRDRLAIFFTRPNESKFSSGGYLRFEVSQDMPVYPQYSYPVCHEANGKLYVIYTYVAVAGNQDYRGALFSEIDLKTTESLLP